MRDSSLRARGNRYSFAQYGASEQGQQQGNHVFRPGLIECWKPGWGEGVTTIRILPGLNEDGTAFEQYRNSLNNLDYGDWIRRYSAVRGFGDPGVTFITSDPVDGSNEDSQMTPGWVLYRSIYQAVKAGQDQQGWGSLLMGGKDKGAMLPRPSEIYLVRAIIMRHNGKIKNPPEGFNPDAKPVVFMMSPSAGLAMLNEFNKPSPRFQAGITPATDYENIYEAGDPISLDLGRFVNFYNLAHGDPRLGQTAQQTGWSQAAAQANQPRNDDKGYGCFVEPYFNNSPGWTAQLSQFADVFRAKAFRWEDVLEFPTIEQQAGLLADKFPPSVIAYAFREHPEWIPEHVRSRITAAVAVAMPGVMPQGFGAPSGNPYAAQMPQQQGWGNAQFAPSTSLPPATPQSAIGAPAGWGAPPAAQIPSAVAPSAQPMAPPVQPGWGAPVTPPTVAPAGAAPQAWGNPGSTPATAPAPQQQFLQPQLPFPAQPTMAPAAAPTMPWGMQPNPAAVPPQQPGIMPGFVTDPAFPAGGIPPAAAPMVPPQPGFPSSAPFPQQAMPPAGGFQPPQPLPPAASFPPPAGFPQQGFPPSGMPTQPAMPMQPGIPAQPSPDRPTPAEVGGFDASPGRQLNPAEQALLRAQQAAGRQ